MFCQKDGGTTEDVFIFLYHDNAYDHQDRRTDDNGQVLSLCCFGRHVKGRKRAHQTSLKPQQQQTKQEQKCSSKNVMLTRITRKGQKRKVSPPSTRTWSTKVFTPSKSKLWEFAQKTRKLHTSRYLCHVCFCTVTGTCLGNSICRLCLLNWLAIQIFYQFLKKV